MLKITQICSSKRVYAKFTAGKHHNKSLYWLISLNPNLTADFVSDNINEGWDWDFISRNKFRKDPFLMKKHD